MLIVDYQSKSYHRFLNDIPRVANHKQRFLVTFNGGSAEDLIAVADDFSSFTKSVMQTTTAITDKASIDEVSTLFGETRNNRNILLFNNADLLFDRRTAVKNSHERDSSFDLNHLFKSIAQHNGIVILATENKQTLSASMSTKVDLLIRFPNA